MLHNGSDIFTCLDDFAWANVFLILILRCVDKIYIYCPGPSVASYFFVKLIFGKKLFCALKNLMFAKVSTFLEETLERGAPCWCLFPCFFCPGVIKCTIFYFKNVNIIEFIEKNSILLKKLVRKHISWKLFRLWKTLEKKENLANGNAAWVIKPFFFCLYIL